MKYKLDQLQSYNVMIRFLENYYQRTQSDDIGFLLGDLQLLGDNQTADPSAWEEYVSCVDEVLK